MSIFPDFEAYLKRSRNPQWYLKYHHDYFFDGLNFLFQKLNIVYDDQSKLIFISNYLLFSYVTFKILKLYNNFNLDYLKLIIIFLFFFNLLFSFEYLLIRVRSGMCILLMAASFIFFLEKKYKLSIILIICGLFTHVLVAATFIYASYFLLLIKKNKYLELLSLVICSIIIMYFTYNMNLKLSYSYNQIYYPLSFGRAYMYCIFPLFFILYINKKNNNFLINKSKNLSELILKMLFYFLLILAFSTFFNLRLFIGESILRMHGIFSFIMLFLFLDRKFLQEKFILNFYTLLINYLLFFKNFVYILK